MPTLKTSFLLLLVAVLSLVGTKTLLENRALQTDLAARQAQRDSTPQVVRGDSTLIRQLAWERTRVQAENATLRHTIRQRQETIRSLSSLTGTLRHTIDSLATQDTTILGTPHRQFHYQTDRWTLSGYHATRPPWYLSITDLTYLLHLDVYVTESRTGTWQTYVDTQDPDVRVSDLATQVQRYQPGFWESLSGSAMLGVGSIDGTRGFLGGLGLAYRSHSVHYALLTTGKRTGFLIYTRSF